MMISIFDIINRKPIENFRNAFFDATGMSVSFADNEHKQYNTFYAGSRCEFCRLMNSSLKGLGCCVKISRESGKRAAISGKALIYTCHAGLKEVVVPIIVGGKHMGSVFSGQVMTQEPNLGDLAEIESHLTDLEVNCEEIKLAFMKIPVVPEWKLNLVSKMLTLIVDYMIQTELNQLLKDRISEERDKFREIIPYIKSQFVNYVITNNTDRLAEINDKLMYLGLKRVPNTVVFLKLITNSNEKDKNYELKVCDKDQITDLITVELNRLRDVLVHTIDNESIAIFIYIDQDLKENIKKEAVIKTANRVRKLLIEKTIYTATIGASRCGRNSVDLSKSYREAFNAHTYAAFIGDGHIVHIDDIQAEGNTGEYLFFDSEKIRKNIILLDEIELLEMYNNSFHQTLTNNEFNLDRIKAFTMEFINELLNSAIQLGLDESYVLKKIEYFQQLILLGTVYEIFNLGKEVVVSVVHEIASGRANRNREIIENAKLYIEENYYKDINLEDVASFVYLSSNYFGWLFKKQIGETYIEFLTKVRVNKAILLMRTTNDSIFNISEKVGYNDPNYFSQVFKKVEGLRPSAYRKMLVEGQKIAP